jgi:hypothetical protein
MSYSAKTMIIYLGDSQPYTCVVCEFVLRDDEDVESVKTEGACEHCVLMFKYSRRKEWDSGWRPTIAEARCY